MDNRLKGLIGFAAVLAVIVLVVAIAGGGDDSDSGSGGDSAKPEVEIGDGDPPTELAIDDLEEGDGAEAKQGDMLSVSYVGVLFDDGSEFDSNFGTGQPFTFQLGAGNVIPGWDEGLVGMKEGGRRQLTIPSDLAYGPQGEPPDIPPDSALVFVIDLESVSGGGGDAAPGGGTPPQ
ncbi:hypothetical protein BH20ACT15_BH20ACT15_06000 [soil metagenome]